VNGEYTFKQRFLLLIASMIGPLLIRLYGATWRVRWDGVDTLARAREIKGKVLFCFWHSRLLGLCYTHRGRGIGIMVSKSFDGEWITRIVAKLGYRTFRGSASRNGAAALVTMLRDKDSCDLALTVDGPRGPAQKVKPGAVALAAHTGLPVVPITYVPSSAWRLNSWDKFLLPKPFSVVTVRYGDSIAVPPDADIEQYSSLIEQGINGIG
jgi:hypothetical protein